MFTRSDFIDGLVEFGNDVETVENVQCICRFFLDKKAAQKIMADENWLTDAGGFRGRN